MGTIVDSTSVLALLSTPREQNWNSKEELRTIITDLFVQKFKGIVSDNHQRMQGYKTNSRVLNQGMYYANDYYLALVDMKQTKRLDWLRDKGNFFHGYAPVSHFTMLDEPRSATGKGICMYRVKPGVSPSDALNEFVKGFSFLGCAEAITVSMYLTVLDMIGKEKFDAIYSQPVTALNIGDSDPIATHLILMSCTEGEMEKGMFGYMAGHPYYSYKHPNGEERGFNVLCSEVNEERKPIFLAFGLDPQGVDEDEVAQALVNGYNKPAITKELISEKLWPTVFSYETEVASRQLALDKVWSIKELRNLNPSCGRFLLEKGVINVDRVMALIQAPLEQVTGMMASWKAIGRQRSAFV